MRLKRYGKAWLEMCGMKENGKLNEGLIYTTTIME